MPLVFGNGGTPSINNSYVGLTYTNATELFNHINNILTKAGWRSIGGASGGEYRFKCLYGNLQNNEIVFRITDIYSNTIQDDIQGRLSFYLTDHSTPNIHYVEFTSGKSNTIFITANNYAAAMANFPFVGTAEIIHMGFLDNLDRLSTQTISNATYAYCYIGKAFTVLNNENIHPRTIASTKLSGYDYYYKTFADDLSIGSHFSGTNSISSSSATPIHTIQNINSGSRGTINNLSNSTTNTNTAYFGNIGNNDERSNLPIIGPYYYLEGYGSITFYGNQFGSIQGIGVAPKLIYNGTVPFLATGFSHLPAFSQWNTESGQVYITGDVPFQGMRIA